MKLEREMFAPVRDWLEAKDFKVFGEFWGHDVVAINGEQLVCVELKRSATRHLFTQSLRATTFCQQVYIGVPTKLKASSLLLAERYGLGILRIGEGVEVVREPTKDGTFRPQRLHAISALKDREPDREIIGGVPVLAGQGPAQLCRKRCAEHIRVNPMHGWKELFLRVHNHYANVSSMRGALGGSAALKHWRAAVMMEGGVQ